VVEIIGAVVLILGHIAGLYVASAALIVNVAFFISGAWLLMVGVHLGLARQQKEPEKS
jgi:predicted phage tail protein